MRVFGWVVVATIVLAGMGYATFYNDLNTGRENCLGAAGDIDAAMQRRADLIPNLVETVRGYAKHEEKVFTAVTEARAKVGQLNVKVAAGDAAKMKEIMAAEAEFKSALGRLLVVAEAYPQLKASENFMALQNQLEGTENRINVARQAYNREARRYNAAVGGLFSGMIASSKGFEKVEYFQADAAARTAPKVNFQ